MTHIATAADGRPLPWIESFGNENDIVARLGMLAPRPEQWGIRINGPRYERHGAWGHMLNEHYLKEIERRQKRGRGPAATARPRRMRRCLAASRKQSRRRGCSATSMVAG